MKKKTIKKNNARKVPSSWSLLKQMILICLHISTYVALGGNNKGAEPWNFYRELTRTRKEENTHSLFLIIYNANFSITRKKLLSRATFRLPKILIGKVEGKELKL
jgi:triacylglycerol esterase/lipase EstA (alpha/beta hydrolase family)